jgi:TPR repeat protein
MKKALVWFVSVLFLSLSAIAGVATHAVAQSTSLDEAAAFSSKGDFAKAAQIYEKLASQGDPVAQHHLAELYYRGLGVSQDSRKAAVLYESAAEKT